MTHFGISNRQLKIAVINMIKYFSILKKVDNMQDKIAARDKMYKKESYINTREKTH